DGNGHLSRITDPAVQTYVLTSSTDGLLSSLTDPNEYRATFTYDADGRLTVDNDAGVGFKTLTRTGDGDDFEVAVSTKLGRTKRFRSTRTPTGARRRTVTDPSGLVSVLDQGTDGTWVPTRPDGVSGAL